MNRGRFITLEGGEGVGKSTQMAALARALRARGCDVVTTREPGGSEGGEAIRALLLSGGQDRWSVRAEALLFAAARADHVERVIQPALAAGQWVLCDRFIDSSRAYQSGAGDLDDADILALHAFGSGGMMPDRTLVLMLDAEESAARAATRDRGSADRIGGRDGAFHAKVRDAFVRYCADEPQRMRAIDAAGAIDAVTARLMDAISDLFE